METFRKKDPQWSEVADIFYWLKSEASNARYYEHLEVIDDLRRETEVHFSKFRHLRKKANKSSQKANEEIKKRFEQLRTTLSRTKGKTPIVGVEKEEEKVPPHK